MKIRIRENKPSGKLDYFKVKQVLTELVEAEKKGIVAKKKEKKPASKKVTFPMDYILFKFPNVKKVLTDLLTVTFKNYIENIYITAPKPSTLKVVLKNKQHFYVIYNDRSYIIKVEGKKYYLLNIGERERAIQAVADLLTKKKFITSKSDAELEGAAAKDSKGGGGGSGGSFPGGGKGGAEAATAQDEELPDLGDLDNIDDGEPPPGTAASKEKEGGEEITENTLIKVTQKKKLK